MNFEQIGEKIIGRGFNTVVKLNKPDGFENRYKELMKNGVPLVFGNHQSHADAFPYAVSAEYLRRLSNLQGLVLPIATSMASGHQSVELKRGFDLLKGPARSMGLETVSVTREKDAKQYGMSRQKILCELRPLVGKIKEGFGLAIFPEGTVQGGRHSVGLSIEQIYGMQEVTNKNLVDFCELMERVTGRSVFYLPLGIHGGFRFVQSPEGGKPKPTAQGCFTLGIGIFGIPGRISIEANLLMPITQDELVEEIGSGWKKNYMDVNEFSMKKVAKGIPDIAKGFYGS